MAVKYPEKESWYIVHTIPKRSGGVRILEEPIPNIKQAQREIYDTLLGIYGVSKFSYGGVKGRNITQAAALHVASKIKMKMDISNFFPSITDDMIVSALVKNKKHMTLDVAKQIAYMCTNANGVLPQGGVTSPCLSNIVAENTYNMVGRMAAKRGLKFSAYVDDFIVSGDAVKDVGGMCRIIKWVCNRHGFAINDKKTVIMRRK